MSSIVEAMLPRIALDLLSNAADTPVDERLRHRIVESTRMRRRISARIAHARELGPPTDGPAARALAYADDNALAEVLRAAGALACAKALRRIVDGARVRALREIVGERVWSAAMTTDAPGGAACPEANRLELLGRDAMLDWLKTRPEAERVTLCLRLPPEDRASLGESSESGHGTAFEAAAKLLDGSDATA